jgi:SPP1 gp7 family putative phage head morphogenesis protein
MLPRMFPPTALAKDYSRDLVQLVSRIRPAFRELEVELPALLASARRHLTSGRMDSGESRRVRQLSQAARSKIAKTIKPGQIEVISDRHSKTVSTYQKHQLDRVVRAAVGVDLFAKEPNVRPQLEVFVQANVQLIEGIAPKVAQDVEAAVLRAIQTGTLHKDLAIELEEDFGFSAKRARIIARDQVGKLYGNLQQVRQRSMGIKRYIWRTVNDERVRPEHEEREGKEFLWDDPPEDGHPGEAINCRCYPEPVVSFDDGDDEDGDS